MVSQAYSAKLGQDAYLPTPNLMLFSLHFIKYFDELSVNNGHDELATHWSALRRLN